MIDTQRASGKIYVIDRKPEKSVVLLICGDDPSGAVREKAISPRRALPLGLYSRGRKLRLDVTEMPPHEQVFIMPRFVDQASLAMEVRGIERPIVLPAEFELTPRVAEEWGWRPAGTEGPATSGPSTPMPA